jgi:hypothetical protein
MSKTEAATMTVSRRRVTRKIVLISFVTSVVLFVAAAPFGHDHHGVGVVLSDIFWPAFLISVVVFLALVVVSIVQLVVGAINRR